MPATVSPVSDIPGRQATVFDAVSKTLPALSFICWDDISPSSITGPISPLHGVMVKIVNTSNTSSSESNEQKSSRLDDIRTELAEWYRAATELLTSSPQPQVMNLQTHQTEWYEMAREYMARDQHPKQC